MKMGPGHDPSATVGTLPVLIAVLCVLLGCGASLLLARVVVGAGGGLAALRFLLGRATQQDLGLASRALGVAGNVICSLALLCAAGALLGNLNYLRGTWLAIRSGGEVLPPEPLDLAGLFRFCFLLFLPLGIIGGRMVLGSAAESAALEGGHSVPKFSKLMPLSAILLLVAYLATFFVKFATLDP